MKTYFLIVDNNLIKTFKSKNIFFAYNFVLNEEKIKGKIQIVETYHYNEWKKSQSKV